MFLAKMVYRQSPLSNDKILLNFCTDFLNTSDTNWLYFLQSLFTVKGFFLVDNFV